MTKKVKRTAWLMAYADGAYLRDATISEARQSIAAAKRDGGAGVISINGRSVYVVIDRRLIDSPANDEQETWVLESLIAGKWLPIAGYVDREEAEQASFQLTRFNLERIKNNELGYTMKDAATRLRTWQQFIEGTGK
jgi:hypothetical protein